MTNRAFWIIGATLFAIVFGRYGVRSQVLNTIPFTASTLETRFRAPGEEHMHAEGTYAVRGNGSNVALKTVTTPKGPKLRKTIVDPTAERMVAVFESTESLITRKAGVPRRLHYPKGCSDDRSAERSVMLGYEVVKVTEEVTVPEIGEQARGLRIEWLAAALDCYQLKIEQYFTDGSGPMSLKYLKEVTSVKMGEPDAALFEIPDAYRERTPSDVLTEYGRMYHDKVPEPELLEMWQRNLDAAYFANRP